MQRPRSPRGTSCPIFPWGLALWWSCESARKTTASKELHCLRGPDGLQKLPNKQHDLRSMLGSNPGPTSTAWQTVVVPSMSNMCRRQSQCLPAPLLAHRLGLIATAGS